ncbi:MAG: UPF0182 family protein [Oligoflexia bacterium]|nr:UPF0182 family protein [Oligoflexia bacterium]
MLAILSIALFLMCFTPLVLSGLSLVRRGLRGSEALSQLFRGAMASGVLLVCFFVFNWYLTFRCDLLWYEQLGQLEIFLKPFLLKWGIFFTSAIPSALLVWLAGAVMYPLLSQASGKNEVRLSLVKFLHGCAAVLSGGVIGSLLASAWQKFVLYGNGDLVGKADPIFRQDISFYLSRLPWLNAVSDAGTCLAFMMLLSAVAVGVAASQTVTFNQAAEERYIGGALKRAALMGIPLALAFAASAYLGRFNHLFEKNHRVWGVSWVVDHVELPLQTVNIAVWIGIAVLLLLTGLGVFRMRLRTALINLGVVLAVEFVAGIILPAAIQKWYVSGNEQSFERPYLAHTMAGTRFGFGLDSVKVMEMMPKTELTKEELLHNQKTLENVRLWDYRALALTLEREQELQPFYTFPDVDVDRDSIGGQYREIMLASREVNFADVPQEAHTWQNEHLVYTHGYGLTLCRANEFLPTGSPNLIVRDMPPVSTVPGYGVTRPEIYFGELTSSYVLVNTRVDEFSHPSGSGSVTSRYAGQAGVTLGRGFRRLGFAMLFGEDRILTSGQLKPESRVLWHRTIRERVKRLVPFVVLDHDEYKVIRHDGSLVYMLDGYTVSSGMPFSEEYQTEEAKFNYIRNAVKIVVDAYHGSVDVYAFDETDPILKAWRKSFPKLIKPWSAMPLDLKEHARYPEDLINIQAERWTTYHMTDPDEFYGRGNQWEVAQEMYGDSGEKQTVEAYNAIIKLPSESREEFLLMVPFTPRGKVNLAGWLAGRSDGEHLGKLIAYKFPRNVNVSGTMMIESRINQHEEWSKDLTLWRQKGSDVIQGNLLVIPIENALFYAEPIYLQSKTSPMPELTRVVVGFSESRLAWGRNFDEAISNLFSEDQRVETGPALSRSEVPIGGVTTDRSAIHRARVLIGEYRELQSRGRFGDAGKKLEELDRLLSEDK